MIYAILGIVGALVQMAALPALSALDAAGTAGAGPAWGAIAYAAQGGLWWFEMLPFALFALLLGPSLRAAKIGFGRVLTVAGVLALIYWALSIEGVAGHVPGAAVVAELAGLWRADRDSRLGPSCGMGNASQRSLSAKGLQ